MSVRSHKTVKFEYDPNRYPRSLPSWGTTNAEYGRFDYRRRTPLVDGLPNSLYRRLDGYQPGQAAQRVVDEGLGDFGLRRSTYVDEISDVAVRNFTRTSQVHADYDGVESIPKAGPYAAPVTAATKNATVGQVYGAPVTSSRFPKQRTRPSAEEYVSVCCPGLQASMAAVL